MDSFKVFQQAVQKQFKAMCTASDHIFEVEIIKDELWDTYLEAFAPGTNPIFRERTEHDCQCCRQFINHFGQFIVLKGSKRMTLWDLPELVGTIYEPVALAMHALVMKQKIKDIFLGEFTTLGVAETFETNNTSAFQWNHFAVKLPERYLLKNKSLSKTTLGSYQSQLRANHDVLKRSLEEMNLDATQMAIDLIEENVLYRGEEHLQNLKDFLDVQHLMTTVAPKDLPDYYWQLSANFGFKSRLRNSAIGTFLVNLSEGMGLDYAVKQYETITAPANYKRPKAIFTKKMLADAKEKLEEMGYLTALPRRYATMDDVTINNVIFANRDVKKSMDVFDELAGTIPVTANPHDSIDITMDDFVQNYVPNSDRIELLLENKHMGNMVSLTAPQDPDAKSMFKWDSAYSWAYVGDVADSIKARVKMAGGDVNGVLRCSLAWFNGDDLDIHINEPNGDYISYRRPTNRSSSAHLDVDMNAGGRTNETDPVENITWTDESLMQEGEYSLSVHQFAKRNSSKPGFEIEIEYNGEIFSYAYDQYVKQNETINVTKFNFSRKDGIKIVESLKSKVISKEVWNLSTMNFHDVTMLMHSPNHWDDKGVGNRHYFFMLQGCENPEASRGFFNEFLSDELTPHRKVLEALGAKMMAYPDPNQLSGVGFASTRRNEVVCRIHSGDAIQTVKIQF